MSLRPRVANRLWQLSTLPEAYRFQSHLDQLKATQERLLQQALLKQAPTAFGRRHQLSQIRNYQDFQDQVPLSDYDDLLPYLSQPRGLTNEPVRMWEPTGGSTAGSKWIPWTASLQAQFRRAVAVWMRHLFAQYPGVRDGRSYWQLTPKTQLDPPPWLAQQSTGFASDGEYLGPLGRWLERSVLISTHQGPDLWERTVRGLRNSPDLRLISCWSPSFLLCLQQRCLQHLGQWEPARWWPRLELISCWTSAASAAYLPRIEQLFPKVAIQAKGLLSTEAVVTIPVGDRFPLAYRSHFFEFSDGSSVLPAWQLEVGQEVGVIVTTGGGLTRYRTNDRVRVTGRLGEVPCLEFLGREGVVDFVGEKLALALLEQVVAELPGFSMFGFEGDGYVLFLDNRSPGEAQQAVLKANESLQACYSYSDALALGQLKPLRGFLVQEDALLKYGEVCRSQPGQGEGSAKPQAFHRAATWSQQFRGHFL